MYYLLKWVATLISLMSEKTLEQTAGFVAYLSYDLFGIRRTLILKNLNHAFGREKTTAEIETLARASVYNFALTILEFLHSYKNSHASTIEFMHRDHIDNALSERQGVYVLCFHLGNWEIMGSAISRNITPAHVIVKKVGTDSVNRFIEELRLKNQFYFISRKKRGDAFRAIRSVLAAGEIVGFVVDQSRPGEPMLPFFGRPAKTNTSFAAIWRRNPAPIVPAFIYRTSSCHHRVQFLPALDLKLTDNWEEDIIEHSKIFNQVVEKVVRQHPEHYFWLHDRWK